MCTTLLLHPHIYFCFLGKRGCSRNEGSSLLVLCHFGQDDDCCVEVDRGRGGVRGEGGGRGGCKVGVAVGVGEWSMQTQERESQWES